MKTVNFVVRLPREENKKIEEICKIQNRTKNGMIIYLIKQEYREKYDVSKQKEKEVDAI